MPETRVTTTKEVETENVPDEQQEKAVNYAIFDQIIYFIFGLIEILLLIRFFFRLTGANPAAGIVSVIYAITNVFMAPFRLIFPTSQITQQSYFEWSVFVAMAFYLLFAWIIRKIIRLVYTADTAK